MRKHLLVCVLFVLFTGKLYAERQVKAIYFVPNDRQVQNDIPDNIRTQLNKVQLLYANQMEAHGYGRKSFTLGVDQKDKIIVQNIQGKHNDAHYHADTLNKVDAETKDIFDPDDIRIIIVDVSTNKIQGNCGVARYHGGPVMIPADGNCVKGDQGVQLLAHELGHALNLVHDWRDNTYIMSYGAHRNKLSECATMLLNVSVYFNNTGGAPNSDSTTSMLTPTTYSKNAEDVLMRFEINDPDGIYQVQMEHATLGDNAGLYGCECVPGKQTTVVVFQMPEGASTEQQNNVWIRVVDMNGNVKTTEHILYATDNINVNVERTYLTLGYDSPDALIPTNPSREWVLNWNKIQNTWEKFPNADIPVRPDRNFSNVNNIPFIDKWEHWIYAHAQSKLVYDLTSINHRHFKAYVYLPNPCGNVASIALMCSVDNNVIYRSGTIKAAQAQNKHISFEVPSNANTFVIEITDAGDGNVCDHYILANMQLQNVSQDVVADNKSGNNPNPHAVIPNDKITMSWAEIKSSQ